MASQGFLTGGILAYISLIKGGLLSYIIMKVIINSHRELLLDVQGSNVVRVFFSSSDDLSRSHVYLQWSGQQVQVILGEFYFFCFFIFNGPLVL